MMRAAAVIAAVVAAGCSSSSGGGSNGGSGGGGGAGGGSTGACSPVSPNACFGQCTPCTRLTQAEVVAAVNAPVVQDPQTGTTNQHACGYSQNDSIGAPIVDVTIDSNITDETFKGICNGTPLQGETITPVAGVGDAACFLIGLIPSTQLQFEKGCWAYSVQITGPAAQYPEATIEADEKAIALDMVPGL